MKPIRIFTNVWGEQHLEWFQKRAMPSLFWGTNGDALKGAKWTICTDRVSVTRVGKILEQQSVIPMEDVSIEILNSPDLLWCLRHVIDKCLKEDSRMLMAPPDTIFGPTTIGALKQLSEFNACVAVPHMRVLPTIGHEHMPLTNANLVSIALRHAHPSWTESEIGRKPSASFYGGIAWQWMQPDLIILQHRLPTVYMANFNEFDQKYFEKKASHFLFWDTYWPHDLVYQERFRVVGSSDVAFMCELTEPGKNMPRLTDINPLPDAYHMMGQDHNLVCRQFMATFREG